VAALDALGPAWIWIIAGLLLVGGELALPGVFLVWLGLAAGLTGLAEAAFGLPWQGQLLLFSVLAVAAVVLASRLNRQRAPILNLGAHRLIGRSFRLENGIVAGEGRVRLDDTLWRVTGPNLPAGAPVRVTDVEGTVLRVAYAASDDEVPTLPNP
jgi:membrane protein implicated in regulation of membrane protease activity